MNSQFLGIKRKYDSLVKDSNLLSSSSSSSLSNDNIEDKKYKAAFKVKLDYNKHIILEGIDDNNDNDNDKKHKDKDKDGIEKSEKPLGKGNTSNPNSSLLSFLPPPIKNLKDKTPRILFEDNTISSMKGLLNPDLNINAKTNISSNNKQNPKEEVKQLLSQFKSIIPEINQNDIIDKDWERKYVDKFNQSQLKSSNNKSTSTINEHNIRNVINEYNETKNESELPIKSKYGKISTKAKYGW